MLKISASGRYRFWQPAQCKLPKAPPPDANQQKGILRTFAFCKTKHIMLQHKHETDQLQYYTTDIAISKSFGTYSIPVFRGGNFRQVRIIINKTGPKTNAGNDHTANAD